MTDRKKISILIADDHEIVLEGLVAILCIQPDLSVIGTALDGKQAVQLAMQLSPDVILMDLVMPQMDGLSAIREIIRVNPSAHIIITIMSCVIRVLVVRSFYE